MNAHEQACKLELHMADGSFASVKVPDGSHIQKYIDAIRQLLSFAGFHNDNINAYLGDN